MKKAKKIWIAGGVLLLAGIIIFVIAMSALDWDFYKLDTATYEEKYFTTSNEEERISAVKISVDSFPVNVKRGNRPEVYYYDASNCDVSVEIENGVLKINEKRQRNFFKKGFFNLGTLSRKYEVIIPDGTNVEFESTNCNITLSGLSAEYVSVKSTNAEVDMSSCTLAEFGLNSTNADVNLSSCNIDNVNVKSTNLEVYAGDCNVGWFTSSSTNCDLAIKNGACAVLSVTSTNNDVYINNVSGMYGLTLAGTNLDADVTIRGIKEEYTITTSGKRLPAQQKGTTTKTINMSGTNNDVELKFV